MLTLAITSLIVIFFLLHFFELWPLSVPLGSLISQLSTLWFFVEIGFYVYFRQHVKSLQWYTKCLEDSDSLSRVKRRRLFLNMLDILSVQRLGDCGDGVEFLKGWFLNESGERLERIKRGNLEQWCVVGERLRAHPPSRCKCSLSFSNRLLRVNSWVEFGACILAYASVHAHAEQTKTTRTSTPHTSSLIPPSPLSLPRTPFPSRCCRWSWAVFYRFPNQLSYTEKAELVSFVDEFELRSGIRTPPGFDPNVRCIRLNVDPIRTIHRPMMVYCGVAVFHSLSKLTLSCLLGFRRIRLGGFNYWFRPATCNHPHHHQYDDTQSAPSGHQHCPKMPIVFLHGLGTLLV